MRTLGWLSLTLLLCFGCSAHQLTGLQPQTGELSFRLLWEGDADLDLHVMEPEGRHVGFAQPYLPNSGMSLEEMQALLPSERGVLDIDCNASPHELCPRPIENVFWPEGAATGGEYRVWVQLFRPPASGEPVAYRLEIREGTRLRQVLEEELSMTGRVVDARYRYRR